MRVLIVEDEPMIAELLAEALTEAGHDVVGPAYRSDDALSLAGKLPPTLAFVDLDLEKKHAGIEVARELNRMGIAVIFATGQGDIARQCACALGLMAKPFRPTDAAMSVPVVEAILGGKMPPPPAIPQSLQLFDQRARGG